MMTKVTIWHNPRCSKSRQALSYLEAIDGAALEIVRYLETPPDEATLRAALEKLGVAPRGLMRKGEALYKELALGDATLSDDALITAMAQNPRLIERPLVLTAIGAALGRPLADVTSLLERSGLLDR